MGGSPDTSAADEANRLAREEAKRARVREAERQARLTSGYGEIRNIFEGTPVYEETPGVAYDWSTFKGPKQFGTAADATGVPLGFSAVKIKGQQAPLLPGMKPGSTRLGSNDPVWGLKDAEGNIYRPGQELIYTKKTEKGRTGGFGEDFYSGISKNVTDLGNLDIADQYNRARENLQYALARQGLTTSTVANRSAADVEEARAKAQGDLALQARSAAAKVRQNVDNEKAAAISQLYATEDPTLAANTALGRSATILADKPNYDTLGNIFETALGGFGNIIQAGRQGGGGTYRTPYAQPAGG